MATNLSTAKQQLESYKDVFKAYLNKDYTSVSDSAEASTAFIASVTSPDITNHFESVLVKRKGFRYKNVKSYSHYNDKIVSVNPYRGTSRIHADISIDQQERVIEDFVRLCRISKFRRLSSRPKNTGKLVTLDDHFIAICIAIMRIESGFNIDASAGTTSAAGYGQFVRKTGKAYGITDNNIWDFVIQVSALINHTLDNKDLAKIKNQSDDYIYAYHHDGPSLAFGGLKLSREKVMPFVDKIEPLVETFT